MKEKWVIRNRPNINFDDLGHFYNLHPAIMKAIINRGVSDIYSYLTEGQLHLPLKMLNMTKGATIIKKKIEQCEPIRIIGDYDIDGINAAYILFMGMRRCKADVSVRFPDRIKDGYGLKKSMIDEAKQDGINTIITCDNGIAAIEAINYGKELGMTIIVTDHHEIPYKEENGNRIYLESRADAIINPHQLEDKYPFKGICGAVVAWKFVQALYFMFHIPQDESNLFIENVAFATIGDVMDLQDENRTIVKKGLMALNKTNNIGMKALIKECGLEGKEIKVYHIGFVLGPCINAAGRLDTAQSAFDLLCCTEEDRAKEIAEQLVMLNNHRKSMTDTNVKNAVQQADAMINDRVLVIYLPECHESIAGIVAGRIREKYNKPVFVITDGEESAKGSGRSIETYSMFEEMNKVSDIFIKFGGHPMAAGFSLKKERIDEFRERINQSCSLTDRDLELKIHIDAVIPVSYTSEYMIEQFRVMEPHGKGNEKPVLADRRLKIIQARILGETKSTVKLLLQDDNGFQIDAMIFGKAEEFLKRIKSETNVQNIDQIAEHDIRINVVYDMSINEFRNKRTPQILIQHYNFV